ncbi:MAG TPA: hypothetical protein VHW69_09135, partial [Rhizomicrobium sp.]|nr:hypothetical protein [Rhizomicrobium sp.]
MATVALFSVVAFLLTIWALFWKRINEHRPKLRAFLAYNGSKIAAVAAPVVLLLAVLVSADAAIRFSALRHQEKTDALQGRVFELELKGQRLQGEADYRRIVIRGVDGTGG